MASNTLEVKVDAIDEKMLMEGFQKVANRITIGLILASLIVGAALLMRVETSFRILGYPGLAIVCFLFAAGGRRRPGAATSCWADHKHRAAHGPQAHQAAQRRLDRAAAERAAGRPPRTGSRVTNPSPKVTPMRWPCRRAVSSTESWNRSKGSVTVSPGGGRELAGEGADRASS